MRIIKGILILIVALIGIGFLLPGTSSLERTTTINAPAQQIFDQANNLRNFNNWSPWAKLDPNAKWAFSEPSTEGVGAYYTWVGNSDVGEGKMTIVESKPTSAVKYKIDFKGQGSAMSNVKLEAKDSLNTMVTWTFDSDHGLNPISRWFGLFINKFVGADYEKGLTNLKQVCEKKG
jgi:hypothetical protein